MSILHRIVRIMIVTLLALGGVMLITAAASQSNWMAAMAMIRQERLLTAGVGVAAIGFAMLYVLSGLRRRDKVRYLSFGDDADRVNISTEAIVDYVTRLADEFPSIVRMRPRVRPVGKAVDMLIDLRIKAGPQLHEICEVLQQRVRESMATGLGISEVRRVVVSVTEISSEHKRLLSSGGGHSSR